MKWQAPPEPKAGKWAVITAALRERPGDWALVLEGVTTANARLLRKRFPGFEFVSRQDGGGKANIFGRYVGGV